MPNDLGALGVEDRYLTVEDGDERVALVADAIENVADVSRALLADLGQSGSCDGDNVTLGGAAIGRA